MKILCLSAYLPGRGLHGGSSRIFELFHYLHRFHELTLLTFRNKNDDDSRVHELKQLCDKLIIVPMPERRPFYLFPFEPFVDYMSVEFRARLQKLLKKERFDLAQLEYVQMGIYLKELGKIPTVLTEHEVNFMAYRKNIPFLSNPAQKVKMYYDSLQVMKRELEILQRVDRIICMNRLEADELYGYVPAEKIDVLPHGVDTDYFAPRDGVETEPLSIGFFGAYHHYPNVDAVHFFVDRVFPLIRERVPEAKFHVIGIHPPKEFDTFRDRPGVVITGFVPDIREALARCQVIVAPLRMGLGMRVKVMEALAMGKPVVATELAAAGLDVVDGQHLIIANHAENFAESVCYLLQDRQCAENLGREGRALVAGQYNYTNIGQRLEAIYQQAVKRR
mgnify:CR=1 FL=1